LAIIWNIKFC